ncbi:hypothetical protein BV898_03231 [Hypsibius exemplaris]|uniref:Uncharacterized protein n=1 Tax=Hypsibius exemplaris TaxID=2072580 RepID=A0A1W0X5I6_HYPEX|nr:hypothetical protein BV898_03231 [Hypsibius exemplaris]
MWPSKRRADFLDNLPNQQGANLLGTVFESSENGLASALTNALNVYTIATRPEAGRVFQLFQTGWNNFGLPQLFNDFAENSSYPLFANLTKSDEIVFQRTEQPLKAMFNKGFITTGGPERIFVHNGKGSQTSNIKKAVYKMSKDIGTENLFEIQSGFLKALWNPNDQLKVLLKDLWCTLGFNSTASYTGIYVPYYDSLTSDQTEDITRRYLNATYQACENTTTPCPKNLLVVHENQDVYRRIVFLAGEDFAVMDLKEAIFRSEYGMEEWTSPMREQLLRYLQPGYVKRDLWLKRNRETMLSMTLLAMGRQVICPMATDVCRVIALLRGDVSFMYDV